VKGFINYVCGKIKKAESYMCDDFMRSFVRRINVEFVRGAAAGSDESDRRKRYDDALL
jgi:hypothetical protein